MPSPPTTPLLQPSTSPTTVSTTSSAPRHHDSHNSIGHVLSQALLSLHTDPSAHTHTSAHVVSSDLSEGCRRQYKRVLRYASQDISQVYAFLEQQARPVIKGLQYRRQLLAEDDDGDGGSDDSDSVTDAAYIRVNIQATDAAEVDGHVTQSSTPASQKVVSLRATRHDTQSVQMFTIGRAAHNDVCVPSLYTTVSRTHCLAMLVVLDTGPMLFLVDMWSKYGTGLCADNESGGGDSSMSRTALTSIPNQRAVLRVPLTTGTISPVVEFGIIQHSPSPLRITFQLLDSAPEPIAGTPAIPTAPSAPGPPPGPPPRYIPIEL